MKDTVKKTFILIMILCFVLAPLFGVIDISRAENGEARDITGGCTFTLDGGGDTSAMTDGSYYTNTLLKGGEVVRIKAPEPIGGVYVLFDKAPGVWGLYLSDGTRKRCGEENFLHEYQSVEGEYVTVIALNFPVETSIADIRILSKGEKLPPTVQVWKAPSGDCDVMLVSCHSDDDQLFFAGVIPDAVVRGVRLQLVQFVNHNDSHSRHHELLNGLYLAGLDRYPIIGELPDTGRTSDEETAIHALTELGFTYDGIVEKQVELIRQYRPTIVITHDINGEYGHGAHILASHAVRDAVESAPDASKYPASAAAYGTHDVKKTYIHLYGENTIDFEIDEALDRFGGKTAFSVSQDAFRQHYSQKNTAYYPWIFGENGEITLSTQIRDYSPRRYGLWRSTVGDDKYRADFYDNTAFERVREAAAPTEVPTAEPTAVPTAGPTPTVTESATPYSTDTTVPEESTQPSAPPSEAPTHTADNTHAPILPVKGGARTLPAAVVVLMLLALLALAAAAMYLVLKYN